jgi:TPP-dependent pyruvate/acetoin dehydrogenase alpha subunit
VLTGKAKFGIFGDSKEIAQITLAKTGDWRAGYYRDQTLIFATDITTTTEFFAQLYTHAHLNFEPSFGGRKMNCHFSTRFLD